MKFLCRRCNKSYKVWTSLRRHSKVHIENKEISLLLEGLQPEETKVGHLFKGKNKIIVA
jgi:hypothetical protein